MDDLLIRRENCIVTVEMKHHHVQMFLQISFVNIFFEICLSSRGIDRLCGNN